MTKNAGTKDISHVDYMLGAAPTGAISGMKFNDIDGDGTNDGGSDPGLAGWTIELDKDANGTVDATTVTGAGGTYSFTGLTAGTYRIREVGQVGWTQTTVNPGDVTVVSGTNSTGNNFGNFQLGAISGKKFKDIDGDGIEDGGDDPGLAGWTIQLDKDANGTVDATTVTGAGGTYSFTGLTAGTYRIREVGQVGWIQTTVNPGDVTVVSGTNSTGNNFGNFQLGAISGKKFNDNDGDGIKDGGDAGPGRLDDPARQRRQRHRRCHDRHRRRRQLQLHGTHRRHVSHPRSRTRSAGLRRPSIRATSPWSAAPTARATTSAIRCVTSSSSARTSRIRQLARESRRQEGPAKSRRSSLPTSPTSKAAFAWPRATWTATASTKSSPRLAAAELRKFASSHQDGTELTQFRTMAYATNFTGGVEVAVGDVNGDGKNDIVTVPTYGATEVRVFYNNYNPANPLADPIANVPNKQFDVFTKKFLGGADVILADVGTFSNGTTVNATTPDGKSEIIVGNGPGMRSTIYVYDVTGTPTVVDTILPFDNKFKGGITLDAARINADVIPDFIVSAGNGGKIGDRDLERLSERHARCSPLRIHRLR